MRQRIESYKLISPFVTRSVSVAFQTPLLATRWSLRHNVEKMLSNLEYVSLMRLRMGQPLVPQSCAGQPCRDCSEPIDIFGIHALTCPKISHWARHNGMCQVVANAARSLALCVRTEVPFAGKERPADIHISPWHEGYPVAVDLTAIYALPLSTRRLSSSSRAAVSQAERDKLARYAHIFDNASTTFVPCCVDVFGTIGPLGMPFCMGWERGWTH